MTHRCLVTIGMAAFNEEGSIRQALQHLLAACDEAGIPCEFLVVASGCTDQTIGEARAVFERSVARQYKIINEGTRNGKSSALNTIISLAAGDIVIFCDADAIASHNAVRDFWKAFFEDPVLGVISARTVSLPGRSRWWNYVGEKSTNALHSLRAMADGSGLWMVSGHLYAVRRALWEPIPLGILADDCYTGLSAPRRGVKVSYLPDVTVGVRYPQALADYLRQKLRNRLARRQLSDAGMDLPSKSAWLGLNAITRLGWRGRQHCFIALLDTMLVITSKFLWSLGFRPDFRWTPIDSSKLDSTRK
jgi:cellulose synthase/poly-beta-1,6-N-acetylglucosamine synthase-like glycosyltransferase